MGLALGAVLWSVWPLSGTAVAPDVLVVGTIAVAVLYGLSEAYPLTLEFRGETTAFTLNGVPLALGLVFLGPVPTLVGRLLGTGIVLALYWRQAPLKLLVNMTAMTLEVWVAAAVFTLLSPGPTWVNGLEGWVAIGAAVVVADLVTGLVVLLAIRTSVGSLSGVLHGFVAGHVINFSIGIPLAVLSAMVLTLDLRAVFLLAPFAYLLAWTNRQRHALGERFASIQRLYGFISSLSTTSSTEVVLQRVLEQARAVSGATAASLLVVAGNRATAWSGRDGALISTDVPLEEADRLLDADVPGTLLSGSDPSRAAYRTILPEVFEQVLIGRFASGELRGALVLADRAGNLAEFDDGDVQLVEALAGHAGTALGSSHLFGRVQTESVRRERLALVDEPTGLPNRNGLLSEHPSMSEGAVFVVGISDLTEFSSGFGHEVAEAIVIEVGDRLQQAVTSPHAVVARITDGQFAILVRQRCDAVDADQWARDLAEGASGQVVRGGLVLDVNLRVGVAMAPAHGTDVRELLRASGRALDEARTARRTIGWFEFERDRETTRRLELASELRLAISNEHLTLAYQPKVDLRTGRVVGVEALVRWPHPARGYIPTSEFIDIAERTGLIKPLTVWVARTAIAQAARWRADGHDISVSINLSNATLSDVDVPWEIVQIVEAHDMPSGSVILEVTESQIMTSSPGGGGALSIFDAAAIPLSMDDFGTDYSSLAQMKNLEVQELKIDRAFITNLAVDPIDRALCAAIITMGHELGIRVVAEGIEDARALEILTELGCDVGQGFHFEMAVPAAQLPTAVREIEAMTVDGTLSRIVRRRTSEGS